MCVNKMKDCIIPVWNKNELEKLHTKQLLKLRHGGLLEWQDSSGSCCELCEYGEKCIANIKQNKIIVKSILAAREHVLNKKESQAKRKALKKKGR